jgi:NAD(P)-dependent dehydrogenase (short-subunit alcohol dehydrogenase family)
MRQVKGSALCSAFATGKFAMRALAQSLAREFGPKGVHVVHAIIDGVIDIERTKDWKFEHEDAKIKPDSVSFNDSLRCYVILTRSPDCRIVLASSYPASVMFYKRDRHQALYRKVVRQ